MNGRIHLRSAIERFLCDGRPRTHASILAVVGSKVPPENAIWAFVSRNEADRRYRNRPGKSSRPISLDRKIRLGRGRFVTENLNRLGRAGLVRRVSGAWSWSGPPGLRDRGVSFHRATQKWRAYTAEVNSRYLSLGYYQTKEEARAARVEWELGCSE